MGHGVVHGPGQFQCHDKHALESLRPGHPLTGPLRTGGW